MANPIVLLVDDDPDIRELTEMALGDAGFDVRSVDSAEAVLDFLLHHRPGLILLDIRLPGLDGIALTRKLRAQPATRDIPIIAHSASGMKGDDDVALRAGCDAYLVKPVPIRELVATVARYLALPCEIKPLRPVEARRARDDAPKGR